MLKSSLFALVVVAASAGGAFAETKTHNALSSYEISQFETQSLPVAVATDKASGRKFNIVKLPNGKMMMLMSTDRVGAVTPFADDSEMMFGTHGGSTR